MIDALGATKGATLLARVLHYYARRNDRAFREARDDVFQLWVAELNVAVRTLHEQARVNEARLAALEARAEKLDHDPQFHRVLDNYGYEAAREALDERRRMLAYAAVGQVEPHLSVAQLARTERTLRELDPADVVLLAVLAELGATEAAEEPYGIDPEAERAFEVWLDNPASGHVLLAAGCVYIRTPHVVGAKREAVVTPLGACVLEILALYLAVLRAEGKLPSALPT